APKCQRLKTNGAGLHLLAGALILAHAISHFRGESRHTLYFWCQLLISIDIFLLVLVGRDILKRTPRVNLFFRTVEIIFFLGIGLLMLVEHHAMTGIFHLLLTAGYCYLFYYERSLRSEETLSIHHTGITIPDIPESRFLYWTHINDLTATYDSIDICTSDDKDLRFEFLRNLQFEELERIQAFCQFYLGKP
ncbi:MAG TPA: hypothetical protein VGQ51_12745, partial [Puia sp.]|nr:hypothetical protein [Puia sp.]